MFTDTEALARSLRLPLDALRATIEAFGHELEDADPRAQIIHGATTEVERLVRRVEELMDFAEPVAPRPARCSVDEVLYTVRAQVARLGPERLLLARDTRVLPLHTDGPLLARALRRLVENALEASGGSVLLSARQQDAELCFSVVDAGHVGFDAEWAARPFATQKSDHLGLGWTLAERDVASLGGNLRGARTPLGDTCVEVRLPLARASEVAA